MFFCHLLIFFSELTFSKNSFKNTIRMSNSLDPDQARIFFGPDLGPNCLPRLTADVIGRQRVNPGKEVFGNNCPDMTSVVYHRHHEKTCFLA